MEQKMEHPVGCACSMCAEDKTFVCQSCGSESKGQAETCCGVERVEKCASCGSSKTNCQCA